MRDNIFTYIDENLNYVLQNPDKVLYFRPSNVGKKIAVFAMVKEESGVYRNLQITKEQSNWTFSWTPIMYLFNGPCYSIKNDYITLHGLVAFNANNIDGFKIKELNYKKYNVGVLVVFNDGSATHVIRHKAKDFEKKGGLDYFINLLKEHKEYNPVQEEYYMIEDYDNVDNTYTISELQKSKTKQLTK